VGGTLSEAMAQHPRSSTPAYLNMVKAGRGRAACSMSSDRLAALQERASN